MNQATEPSEDSDVQPASAEGGAPAVEKSRSRARKKAAPAPEERAEGVAEAKAEPVAEQELRTEPVEASAPAAGPPVADEGVAAPAVAAPAPSEGAPAYGATQPAAAGRPERRRGGRYPPRRKVCSFCVDHVDKIDYKDAGKLRRYLSDRGKIEPRRKTGTCAKHQRRLTIALKRARHLALLPYTSEHMRLTGSPAPRS